MTWQRGVTGALTLGGRWSVIRSGSRWTIVDLLATDQTGETFALMRDAMDEAERRVA